MKYLYIIVLGLVAWILFKSFSSQKPEENQAKEPLISATTHIRMKPYTWLLGTWKMVYKGTEIYETWQVENDSLWKACAYTVDVNKINDTFETIKLYPQNMDLVFATNVKNQNMGKDVMFLIAKDSSRVMIAENKDHDFPQNIKYTWKGRDTLLVELSGKIEDQEKQDKFLMFKTK